MIVPTESVHEQSFDYVLIGGGTAGLTLAARLTEDPATNVLVLEAGEANIDDPMILRPACFGAHLGNKAYSWDHPVVAQKNVNNREFGWHRGKGLGGTSSINFLCYTRPPARDVDDFARLGNAGWDWGNLVPYFERAEGFGEPAAEYKKLTGVKSEDWKVGREGPVKVTFPPTIAEAEVKLQQSFVNSGVPYAAKPLGGEPAGVSFLPSTYDLKTHKRSYATTAYYLPYQDRPNYKVVTGARVTRVLTEASQGGNITATGVEFLHESSGKTYTVKAKKEVEICTGVLKSPQVLELSGFGRKDVLDKIGVPVKVEIPGVGENVQDHIFVGMSWELKDDVPFETLDLLRDPESAKKHLELHDVGKGLHTSGVAGFAWCTLDMITSADKQAQIHQKMQDAVAKLGSTNPGLKAQYEIALERFAKSGSPGCEYISFPGFLSGPNPPEPGKRGTIASIVQVHANMQNLTPTLWHSTSSDPLKEPEVDAHYYEQSVDLDVHIEMAKFARKVMNTAPFSDLVAKEQNPGLGVQTDEQWAEWIKATFGTTWHTAGGCPMLPRDKGGVVDTDLKVYGTTNLRVVDLSVVPLHFASPPQSAVYAIAEKATEIIKST